MGGGLREGSKVQPIGVQRGCIWGGMVVEGQEIKCGRSGNGVGRISGGIEDNASDACGGIWGDADEVSRHAEDSQLLNCALSAWVCSHCAEEIRGISEPDEGHSDVERSAGEGFGLILKFIPQNLP